jgi:hypothetical protein
MVTMKPVAGILLATCENMEAPTLFDKIAEQKIEEAIAEGAFENLRGRGEPLNASALETPLDIKILKNAGVAPEWIQISKELGALREECRTLFERTGREYRRRKEIALSPASTSVEREEKIGRFLHWLAKSRDSYRRSLKSVNTEILKINMLAPGGGQVLFPYQIEKELQRFDDAYPCLDGWTMPLLTEKREPESDLKDCVRMLYRYEKEKREKA